MDHALYLRARADEFAILAVITADPVAAQNYQELAVMCREGAERLEKRQNPASGSKLT
jgi:hypothetical protein